MCELRIGNPNSVRRPPGRLFLWLESTRHAASYSDIRFRRVVGPILGGPTNSYHIGAGVTKDYAEAVKWYRKAADQGDARGQSELGNCYASGQGVTEEKETGYMWYLLAEARGIDHARQVIEYIEKKLTPEQRLNGQKRAREWQAAFDKAKGN